MKKVLSVILAVVLILSLFTACGKVTVKSKGKGSLKTTTAAADTKKDEDKDDSKDSDKEKDKKDTGPKLTRDQKAIYADLEKTFGEDGELLSAVRTGMTDDEAEEYEKMGLDIDEFADAMMKHFTFEYGDIVVKGDEAVVNVVFNYIDVDKMSEDLEKLGNEWLEKQDPDTVEEEDFYKAYGKIVMDYLTSEDCKELSEEFELNYVKDGDEWQMADDGALDEALGGIDFG